MEICAEWEAMTRLHLEHSEYSKLVLASMSDYIGVRRDGKIKCKGRFDFEDLALHKDKSFLVVPKALYQYFIHGVKPEDYIENNQNIYDYCAGAKVRGASHFEETRMTSEGQVTKKLQKIVRYYNSTNGAKLVKVSNDNGKRTQLESGKWLQTTFNRFEERSWEDYDVNTEYYLQQIYREINNVDRKVTRTYSQLELFA